MLHEQRGGPSPVVAHGQRNQHSPHRYTGAGQRAARRLRTRRTTGTHDDSCHRTCGLLSETRSAQRGDQSRSKIGHKASATAPPRNSTRLRGPPCACALRSFSCSGIMIRRGARGCACDSNELKRWAPRPCPYVVLGALPARVRAGRQPRDKQQQLSAG